MNADDAVERSGIRERVSEEMVVVVGHTHTAENVLSALARIAPMPSLH
jgi:hypothetical protein